MKGFLQKTWVPILFFVVQSHSTASTIREVVSPLVSICSKIFELNGQAVFCHEDLVHGRELIITDGSKSGGKLVKDIAQGSASSNPKDLLVHEGSLYFLAESEGNGLSLWVSDGTPDKTFPISSNLSDRDNYSLSLLGSSNGALFLQVGIELFIVSSALRIHRAEAGDLDLKNSVVLNDSLIVVDDLRQNLISIDASGNRKLVKNFPESIVRLHPNLFNNYLILERFKKIGDSSSIDRSGPAEIWISFGESSRTFESFTEISRPKLLGVINDRLIIADLDDVDLNRERGDVATYSYKSVADREYLGRLDIFPDEEPRYVGEKLIFKVSFDSINSARSTYVTDGTYAGTQVINLITESVVGFGKGRYLGWNAPSPTGFWSADYGTGEEQEVLNFNELTRASTSLFGTLSHAYLSDSQAIWSTQGLTSNTIKIDLEADLLPSDKEFRSAACAGTQGSLLFCQLFVEEDKDIPTYNLHPSSRVISTAGTQETTQAISYSYIKRVPDILPIVELLLGD